MTTTLTLTVFMLVTVTLMLPGADSATAAFPPTGFTGELSENARKRSEPCSVLSCQRL